MIAGRVVYYHKRLALIEPEYDECGEGDACDKTKERDGYCAECPVGEAWRGFRADTEEDLRERGITTHTFDSLWRDLCRVYDLDSTQGGEGANPEWTIQAHDLVQITRSERRKAERIDRWNLKQAKG